MTDTSYLYQYFLQRSSDDKKPEIQNDKESPIKNTPRKSKKKDGKEHE